MALPAPHRTGRHVARAGPRLAAAACCLALGITACSSDGDAEPEPPTAGTDAPGATAGTGTSAPGTTAMADEEAAVLEAVDGYWRTWLAANDPPDPDHPDLEKYATGAALERMRQSIAENKAKGVRIVAGSTSTAEAHRATVLVQEHGNATVRDCSTDDLLQLRMADGAVVDDSVVTRLLTYELVLDGGTWKITSNEEEGQWDGRVQC